MSSLLKVAKLREGQIPRSVGCTINKGRRSDISVFYEASTKTCGCVDEKESCLDLFFYSDKEAFFNDRSILESLIEVKP